MAIKWSAIELRRVHGTLRAILFVAAIALCSACGGSTTQEVQNRIENEKALRDLDRFCMDLPKPDGFRLTGKQLGGNSDTWYIQFNFLSTTSFAFAEGFMSDHFDRLQWQKTVIVRDEPDFP